MSQAPALAPVNPPLAIFGRHVKSTPSSLLLLDKMFASGDDYAVHDVSGEAIIRVNAKEWSTLDKKIVYSGERETLCEIKDKAITLHHTIEVLAPGGHVLFKIQKHKDNGVKGFQVHLDKLIIDVLGDWTDRTAEFRLNQQVIARAGRENISVAATEYVDKGGDAVYGESAATRYRVDVAPGVDLVLMAIICVCLDEIVKQTHI